MNRWKQLKKTSAVLLGAAVAVSGFPAMPFAAEFGVDEAEQVVFEEPAEIPEEELPEEALLADVMEANDAEILEIPSDESPEFTETTELFEAPESDVFGDGEEISAFSDELTADGGEYVYGTIDLSYADFYYGELRDVPENAVMDLNTADPVTAAGYRSAGMYDAVTSATTSKWSKFEVTYTTPNEDGTGAINGIADVAIAVPKALYEEVKAAEKAGQSCNNKLFDFVDHMTILESVPTEYKVLNGDGTLGAMVTEKVVDEAATASITTDSPWGNYQVSVKSSLIPTNASLANFEGVVIETEDGSRYGTEHLENLWLQPQEMSFAVQAGFVEPHGNSLDYLRYADLPGKTIKKITYMVKDGADVVINTSLLCKVLVDDTCKVNVEDGVYSKNGVSVSLTAAGPAGSNYQLASVSYGGKELDQADYQYKGGILTINGTSNTGAGQYTALFTDSLYEDMKGTFILNSGLKDGDVKLTGNKLVVDSDVYTAASYLSAVTSLKVDGVALGGRNISGATSAVFKDGSAVDFDAAISGKGGSTPVFTKGTGVSYVIEMTANGFPSVSGTVVSPADTTKLGTAVANAEALKKEKYSSATWTALTKELKNAKAMLADITGVTQETADAQAEKVDQAVKALKAAVFKFTKTSGTIYTKGTTSVTLKLSKNVTGTVTYTSSAPKVASVSSKGVVKAKKAGTAVITAKCGSYKATYKVTVKNPSIKLSKTKATLYTKGTKKLTLKTTKYGVSGTVKYTSSNPKVAAVNAKGVVTAKKTGTAVITAKCGSYKATCKITVKKPSLKLAKSSGSVKVGKTITIKATAAPKGTITYVSNDKKVASVNSKGVVKGLKKGKATIKVTCNGVVKTFTVTVK